MENVRMNKCATCYVLELSTEEFNFLCLRTQNFPYENHRLTFFFNLLTQHHYMLINEMLLL